MQLQIVITQIDNIDIGVVLLGLAEGAWTHKYLLANIQKLLTHKT